MKIAIVNDIHIGRPLVHNNTVRAPSHLLEENIGNFLQRITQRHSPDLLINLGDLIRSEDREKDFEKYLQVLAHFSRLKTPVIHLLGNHELKKMNEKVLEKAWLQSGFCQKSYGCKTVGGALTVSLVLNHTY